MKIKFNDNLNLEKILRKLKSSLLILSGYSVSSDYINLSEDEFIFESNRLSEAWKNVDIPKQQSKITKKQLKKFKNQKYAPEFNTLVEGLRALPDTQTNIKLLEIGCASGYYSEVLEIAGIPFKYYGCDYSKAFINIARSTYPELSFEIQDNKNLRYNDNSFEIVVSGCCILHISEYKKAILETVRVAKKYVVFHRTPVVTGMPQQMLKKKAYGIETIEIHFNEYELLDLFSNCNLKLLNTISIYKYSSGTDPGVGRFTRSYFCEKITND